MKQIFDNQYKFQKEVGFPIDSTLEHDRNEMSEKYILKMIEEIIEFRREFPSVANPWSKHQKMADPTRVIEELSDVFLFFTNILLVWRISWEDFLVQVQATQENNFRKIKERKMEMLNSDILKIPNQVSGVGHGNLSPKFVFVGQSPNKSITQGSKFWSDPNDDLYKILIPVLDDLGIKKEDCYFTNLIKCSVPHGSEPDEDLVNFYREFYSHEIKILGVNNPGMNVIGMGQWVKDNIPFYEMSIEHPEVVLHGTDLEFYRDSVKQILKPLV